jgi:CubicO group peptidase (beta-lactamase class C family)
MLHSVATTPLQTTKADKLEAYFAACSKAKICNGAFSVSENGKVIFSKAYGHDGSPQENPIDSNSQFDIGSISKQFTAMAILKLVDEQKVGIDDNVHKYFPELPYENITIRHLLTHTSGVPDAMEYLSQQYRQGTVKQAITHRSILNILERNLLPKIQFDPGEKFAYSNTGYVLLANIVEKASEESFSVYMEKTFFSPLDMQQTLVRTPETEHTLTQRVFGFFPQLDGTLVGNDQIPFLYLIGPGGIYSSIQDLNKWENALNHATLISEKTWEQATTPVILNDGSQHPYGFGFSLKNSALNQDMRSHGGHWRGFKSYIAKIGDLSIIQLTNNSQDDSVDQHITSIEALINDKPYEIHKESVVYNLYNQLQSNGIEQAKRWLDLVTEDDYAIREEEMNFLASYFSREGNHKNATAVFEMALQKFPHSASAHENLVDSLIASENYEQAELVLTKLISLNPDHPSISKKRAQISLASKQTS